MRLALERIRKSPADDARLEALLAGLERDVRRAFEQYLADVKSESVRREIANLIERGDIEGAMRTLEAFVIRFGRVIPETIRRAMIDEAEALAEKADQELARILIAFDPGDPRAAEMMRLNMLEFIREFSDEQRRVVRDVLIEALGRGASPLEVGRLLQDAVGLTQRQWAAVGNYRRLLESGVPGELADALIRDLRNRSFDGAVRRAIRDGVPIPQETIERMVASYIRRYEKYRAETIARTEALRSMSQGRQAEWQQLLDQGFPPERLRRVWRSTKDHRTRDTHRSLDGQERGLDEPFVSPSGARLMYPGDPDAPAAEVVNCRCVVELRILPPE